MFGYASHSGEGTVVEVGEYHDEQLVYVTDCTSVWVVHAGWRAGRLGRARKEERTEDGGGCETGEIAGLYTDVCPTDG